MMIDSLSFRRAMATFCSGVVVLTAMDGDTPVGMTCQSFTSLSLDPPLVLVSPAKTSTTWPRIESAGHFAVNVLRHEQDDVSSRFARSGADKFADQEWTSGETGSPLLHGALSHIECAVDSVHPGGDHHIVVGRVLSLHLAEDTDSAAPLLFYRSAYATLRSA